MKHFIYTYHEGKPPRDGSGILKTVKVYRIKKGTPVLVVKRTDTFVNEYQLVLEALESVKALPSRAFERSPNHGGFQHNFSALETAGIANINRVD
jgi:hypothetical protein